MPAQPPGGPRPGVAFLLAQIGARASEQFAEALTELDLTPAIAGILRVVRNQPGLSQQELARRIGLVPSRVVAVVDDLEARGWISRTRDPTDRRVNVLALTDAGNELFAALARVARAHEQRVTAGLDDTERATLLELLTTLAERMDLTPGVHPGYRQLR